MKSYCIKQKKQTECVKGSQKYFKAKNGRNMMKCKCAECGISKTKFLKQKIGKGISDVAEPIKNVWNIGEKISTTLFPSTKQNFKDFWSGKLATDYFGKHGIFSKEMWTDRSGKSKLNGNLKDCAFALPDKNGKLRYFRCK